MSFEPFNANLSSANGSSGAGSHGAVPSALTQSLQTLLTEVQGINTAGLSAADQQLQSMAVQQLTNVLNALSAQNPSAASLETALQALQSLLQQVQAFNATGDPAIVQQLQQQLVQQLGNAIIQLQLALQTLSGGTPTAVAPAAVCQGTFLESVNNNQPEPIQSVEQADGSYLVGTAPYFFAMTCANGVVTVPTLITAGLNNLGCTGTYSVSGGKTIITGTCVWVPTLGGGPMPWSLIQQ